MREEKRKEEEEVKKRAKIEQENNEKDLEMFKGEKVTYGQQILLRHVFSNQFLALNPEKMSPEFGCIDLSLEPLNPYCSFIFLPAQLIKYFTIIFV